jgi:hypothetical protein
MTGPTVGCTIPQVKPPYPEAFDRIAGLPPEINPNTISLLIQIWRHTNSNKNHQNFGKAWMAQPNLAQEMHLSDKTIQRAFDDGCARGLIDREHLFKKNGKVMVSTAPYHKATSKEMGEYLGSRYWLNWSNIKKLQVRGAVLESTPNQGNDTNGVVTESTPNSENGVVRESIRVVRESTPVVGESTKGLREGLSQGPNGLDGMDGGMDGAPAASFTEPISENSGGQKNDKPGEYEIEHYWDLLLPDGDIGPAATQTEMNDLVESLPQLWRMFHRAKTTSGNGDNMPILSITKNEKKKLAEFVSRVRPLAPHPDCSEFAKDRCERICVLFARWAQHKGNVKNLKHPVGAFLEQFREALSYFQDCEGSQLESQMQAE